MLTDRRWGHVQLSVDDLVTVALIRWVPDIFWQEASLRVADHVRASGDHRTTRLGGGRELKREHRAVAGAGGLRADLAAHRLDQRLRDRQPDASSAQRPRPRLVHPVEPLEDARQ